MNDEKNKSNANGHHLTLVRPPSAPKCPACDQPVTREKLDEILCISEAREERLDAERAQVEAQQKALRDERDKLVADAVLAEQLKWSAVAGEMTAEVAKLKGEHKAALVDARAAAEEKIEAEVKKRTVTLEKIQREREVLVKQLERERQLREKEALRFVERQQKEVAGFEAKAAAAAAKTIKEAETRMKEERRVILAQQDKIVATLEDRRTRESDAMRRQINDLQRRADGRDRAHYGPEGEEELTLALREAFPHDRVTRIAPEGAGDVLLDNRRSR